MTTPEQKARETIDRMLDEAGWVIQNKKELNLGVKAINGVDHKVRASSEEALSSATRASIQPTC